MTLFIGIDPGLSGALAFRSGEEMEVAGVLQHFRTLEIIRAVIA